MASGKGEYMATSRTSQRLQRFRPASPSARRRCAFTLLEVLLALSLLIAMMAGIYEFYITTVRSRDAAIRSLRQTLTMRALLEQIAEDLRHITDTSPDGMGFLGTEEQLTFVRLNVPDMGMALTRRDPMRDDPKPGQEDLVRITYSLKRDDTEENLDEDGTPVVYGLLRTSPPLIDPNPSYTMTPEAMAKYEEDTGFKLEMGEPPPSPSEDLIPEIKYLRFWFYDGKDWYPRWQTPPAEEADDAETDAGETDGTADESGGTGEAGDTGTPGDSTAGASPTGKGESNAALPQAIQIIVGTTKVPRAEDEFDISRVFEENKIDNETYHADRWTIRVYLRQSDQSLLSSRGHGISITGEQSNLEKAVGGLR